MIKSELLPSLIPTVWHEIRFQCPSRMTGPHKRKMILPEYHAALVTADQNSFVDRSQGREKILLVQPHTLSWNTVSPHIVKESWSGSLPTLDSLSTPLSNCSTLFSEDLWQGRTSPSSTHRLKCFATLRYNRKKATMEMHPRKLTLNKIPVLSKPQGQRSKSKHGGSVDWAESLPVPRVEEEATLQLLTLWTPKCY